MKRKYSKAIKETARQHGVPEEIVYNELQQAISAGYNNPDPEVQKYWRKIAPDDKMPTPEKLIEILAKEVKLDKK